MPNKTNVRRALDEVANALQVAALLSTSLRRGLGDTAQTAIDLEAAISRAAKAIRDLQPRPRAKKGAR